MPFHGDVALVPERPPLERIDPDPEHLTRLKATTAREVDRPPAINKALTRVVPQFFLRNTDRVERYASTRHLEFTGRELINLDFLDDVEAARRCHFDRFDLRFESSSLLVAMLLAERNVVMVETRWHEVFGRPDPVE